MKCSTQVYGLFLLFGVIKASPSPQDNTTAADFRSDVNQSPISLTSCLYKEFPDLVFDQRYWTSNTNGFILHNTGHSVEIHYPAQPPSMLGGPLEGQYSLAQIHFHWGATDEGSEHAIDNKYYAMEAHLVHYKKDYGELQFATNHKDGVAVVAVMFAISDKNNSAVHDIVDNLSKVRRAGRSTVIGAHSMAWLQELLQEPQEYFTYFGSLTTPLFNEVVTWIIIKNTSSIGRDQIREFRELLGHNANIVDNRRDLQDLNDRSVWCSSANVHHSGTIMVLTAAILAFLFSPSNLY